MIPIDSKFVVEPFRQLGATRDDPRLHNQARAKFRQNLKKIIDEVADKYIRPGEDTYDFAFLFVPSEVVYHEVISDEGIMDRARERSVVLASPQGLGTYLDVVERAQRALKLDERAADTVGRIDQIRRDFDALQRLRIEGVRDVGNDDEQLPRSLRPEVLTSGVRCVAQTRHRLQHLLPGGGSDGVRAASVAPGSARTCDGTRPASGPSYGGRAAGRTSGPGSRRRTRPRRPPLPQAGRRVDLVRSSRAAMSTAPV